MNILVKAVHRHGIETTWEEERQALAMDTIYFGILLWMCLFPAAAKAGNTYYVAINGSDTNTGTLDMLWLTIPHAAETMVA